MSVWKTNLSELNMFSLRFRNGTAERRFLCRHMLDSRTVIRLGLVAGAAIYAVFGVLDVLIVPDDIYNFWIIRLGVVFPAIGGMLLFTYSKSFVRFAQLGLSLAMFAAGMGIIAMTVVGKPPASHWYYAGLISVVIYCASVLRIHHVYSLIVSIALFGCYQISAIYLNPTPHEVLLSNNFFLAMAIAVGATVNYVQELYLRLNYLQTRLLISEKAVSEKLRRKADAANRAKTEFLASMSHELRTPLNAIIGFSEIVKEEILGPLGTSRYKSYAEDIYSSGTHLLNIIGDMLDLATAEAGKLTFVECEFDLCKVVDECLRMFQVPDISHGLRISASLPSQSVKVYADPGRIRQIVINLVSNGVKFTEKGGEVCVSLWIDETGSCVLSVADSGIGMAADELGNATQPFFRAGNPYTSARGGTGLGLPIVQKIIEWHGGQLKIESKPGQGTVVTMRLPPERTIIEAPRPLTLPG
ncbi:MAG: HAMP domain-containing histidine kinase [Rhodospirillales bacterium]|nr:MAG: HAMP domain-containing histidine kinase [Rhodospirillales bacterium]